MASMTRRVVYVLVCVTGFFTIPAVAKAPGVEVFARHNKVQNVQISPDGKHIAFNFEAENNEVKLAIASSDLSRIVHVLGYGKNHHLGNHFWVSNTRILSWEWRNTGNLDGRRQFRQLIGLDFDGENREILFVPERSSIEIYSRFRADPEHIIVGKRHWRDEGQVSLYKLNVMDGELDFLGGLPFASAESRIVDMAVDLGGELRLAIENYEGEDEYDPDDDTSYVHYKSRSGDWKRLDVKSARSRPKFLNLGFDGSNRILYFLSDYDVPRNDPSVRGTLGVFSFNFDTEKVNLVFRHPDVDIERGLYGPQGEVLGVRYEPGYPQHHYFDSEDADTKLWLAMEATFPGQQVTISNYTWDEERAVVHVYSDKNPGTYYLFGDGKLRHIADVQPEIDPDWLGSQEAFTMSARDGVKLYGFLTLPPGNNDKNLPMVVNPHGGPHGPYDEWGYDRDVQMLAAHGYAVLQVNFRGSGGYGDDFERSGWRQWGRKMQDDVTDATRWAIQQGIADPDRICLYGGSYGGYATLQGLVREPDLYKCGIGLVGVYSLPMMWEKGDGRRQGFRRYSDVFLDNYIGKDEDELRAYSPAYNVDKIKAAVFIIHGTEDVRVPIEHAELLATEFDKIGKPYEWMVREEGHGFANPDNRADQYRAMLDFLEKHIGVNKLASN